MPYISRKARIAKTEYDARVKIIEEMKKNILDEQGKLSQRETARKYGISRSSVRFIWMPEKLERAKELYKERRKDGRYYERSKSSIAMKKHRRRKHKLYKKGLIKLEDKE